MTTVILSERSESKDLLLLFALRMRAINGRVPHPFRVLQRNGWETTNPTRIPQP
jgi:hypothetical protein